MANLSSTAHPSRTRLSNQDNPDEEDIQTQVAETINDSPSSAIPIPRSPDQDDDDLERGDDDMAATLVNDQPHGFSSRGAWRGLASLSLSAFHGDAAWRSADARNAEADRNR